MKNLQWKHLNLNLGNCVWLQGFPRTSPFRLDIELGTPVAIEARLTVVKMSLDESDKLGQFFLMKIWRLFRVTVLDVFMYIVSASEIVRLVHLKKLIQKNFPRASEKPNMKSLASWRRFQIPFFPVKREACESEQLITRQIQSDLFSFFQISGRQWTDRVAETRLWTQSTRKPVWINSTCSQVSYSSSFFFFFFVSSSGLTI